MGRARASVAKDRAEAMVLCMENNGVAKCKLTMTMENKGAVIG